ncbi:MAG: SEC-C metal-binding domain-containing protein [bacterium]
MSMIPFSNLFPEIGPEETRWLLCRDRHDLPDGGFAFVEHYCGDKDCDCHRVIMTVVSPEISEETVATINYGWKSTSFYEKWYGDRELGKFAKGPFLDPLGLQSSYASVLLYLFKNLILKDKAYVARLNRHYEMFKRHLREHPKPRFNPPLLRAQKIGRNERCPCGSSRKFKHCCGNIRMSSFV